MFSSSIILLYGNVFTQHKKIACRNGTFAYLKYYFIALYYVKNYNVINFYHMTNRIKYLTKIFPSAYAGFSNFSSFITTTCKFTIWQAISSEISETTQLACNVYRSVIVFVDFNIYVVQDCGFMHLFLVVLVESQHLLPEFYNATSGFALLLILLAAYL